MKKRLNTALLLLVILLAVTTSVQAINTDNLYGVRDFKFHQYKNGIGYGACPVYTAPSLSAYRVGNATCATNSELYIAGVGNGGWLLVRYETSIGGVRVGYIPPDYVRGFKFDKYNYIDDINYSYIPCVAQEDIDISDNPMSNYSSFGTIHKGEQYYIMATYTYYGNWWYVECTIEGRPARGFISRDTVTVSSGNDYGSARNSSTYNNSGDSNKNSNTNSQWPDRSPLGTRMIGTLTITADATLVRKNASPETDMVGRVQSYETYPYYEYKNGSTGGVWYYIYIYEQNVWGWVAGGRCRVN